MKANGINIINAAVLARDAGLTTSARHVASPKFLSEAPEELEKMLQLTVRRGSFSINLIGIVVTSYLSCRSSWIHSGCNVHRLRSRRQSGFICHQRFLVPVRGDALWKRIAL